MLAFNSAKSATSHSGLIFSLKKMAAVGAVKQTNKQKKTSQAPVQVRCKVHGVFTVPEGQFVVQPAEQHIITQPYAQHRAITQPHDNKTT